MFRIRIWSLIFLGVKCLHCHELPWKAQDHRELSVTLKKKIL